MAKRLLEDEEDAHTAIWVAIEFLISCVKWAGPVIIALLGTILSYAYTIERTLSDAMRHSAMQTSKQEATELDLQDKYDRHLSVHIDLKDRIDRIEGSVLDAHFSGSGHKQE